MYGQPAVQRAWVAMFAGCVLALASCSFSGEAPKTDEVKSKRKYRLFVVSSYHREYLWSQDTHRGVCAALVKFGFLGSDEELKAYAANDYVEGASALVKKTWMDCKRKSRRADMVSAADRTAKEILAFSPDLILLGDDNAANLIGSVFLDTETPVVFWGLNVTPLKYGLVETAEKPGHNVSGVYQPGYPRESLEFLMRLVPQVKRFAILSDDTETGRSRAKQMRAMADAGALPAQLVECVITNSFSEWKSKVVALQAKVDAFYVVNHNCLQDEGGAIVDQMAVGKWYLNNCKLPDCSDARQFVEEGVLCACDDSGFNQGYEAVRMAHQILVQGKKPAELPCLAPARGPLMLNRQRAEILGLKISDELKVEEYIEKALALDKADPAPGR